jgi:hypothetical protein
MVTARTCLHAHQAVRLFGEEGQQFAASQFSPKHGATGRIYTVNLKDGLGEIKADRDNGHDGSPW